MKNKKTKKTKKNSNNISFLIVTIVIITVIIVIINSTKLLGSTSEVYVVSNGSLSYEESAEGYIIRDEVVLSNDEYQNGMIKVVPDGERASKSEMVFRYYSSNEDNILKQIAELDEEMNEIIETTGVSLGSSDIPSLEKQIETTIDSMYNLNYLQKIQENKNKIETYISKKTQITESLSPEDSYLKQLAEKRVNLEKELENESEKMYSPIAGMVSYRVDGLEDILKVNDFDYLTTELLSNFDLKVGAVVPLSNEKGKIVDNFKCYIAAPINTEKSLSANVGDTVSLRLSNLDEVDAEIIKIIEEDNGRIIVFEITSDVDSLLEYRKISFDIIWWKYSGLKVSNSSLIEEYDKTYVERRKAGYTDKILVKVLRQNDTYSIVINYDEDELKELGYSEDEISSMLKIKLYDEILLH